jgi:methionyl-tRNA formyltransferase
MVVTTVDRPAGRGRKVTGNVVKSKANELGLSFIQINKFDGDFFNKIKEVNFDAAVIVSFGRIFPEKIFDLKSAKWVNVHPSLLPRHRGPNPIVATLLRGDRTGGVSIIEVKPEVDAGDIYAQVKFRVDEDDNRAILEKKSIAFGCPILIKVLDLIETDSIKPYPQGENNISYSYKIKKEDLKINWENSAEEIVNAVRAFSPEPGAYCVRNGLRIKILKAAVLKGPLPESYLSSLKTYKERPSNNGLIIKADREDGILVKCNKNRIIRVLEVQPEGKKVMSAVDFINGYRIEIGDNFE